MTMTKRLSPAAHKLRPHPDDCRRLLLDDGRPVLSVIGGGHEQPFSRQDLETISAWVCECWNALSVADAPWPKEADPLTLAIQHLNSNPYALTKEECIDVLKTLRDLHQRRRRTLEATQTDSKVN